MEISGFGNSVKRMATDRNRIGEKGVLHQLAARAHESIGGTKRRVLGNDNIYCGNGGTLAKIEGGGKARRIFGLFQKCRNMGRG